MQTVIILIHLMVVLVMIGLVLLQKSEGGGLGMGSGGGGFMSSRGTANVLTRATAILAAIFFSTSLLLSVVAGIDRKPTSILGGGSAPGSGLPSSQGTPGGVFDQLGTPAAPPAAPAAPEAPKSQ
jgi:preprotein translocase subunit SecG